MARKLNIDAIGVESFQPEHTSFDLILRIRNNAQPPGILPQLVVSDDISKINTDTDIVTISDLAKIDHSQLKKKMKPKIGFEIFLANARGLNGKELGKWMSEAKYLYRLSRSTGCQFILSSGAQSIFEMLSARTFESILSVLGIAPLAYWKHLSDWLAFKDTMRSL
jgi:hypothetical protein